MTARILIVDDVPANVRLLQAKLEADYHEVLSAANGREALTRAVESQPDIILLDVMMPEIDGYEVCRQLKNNPDTRHIPIILVTALDGREDRLSGLEAGADDFMTKPLDDIMLMARLQALVRLKQMADDLRVREANSRRAGLIDNDQYQRQISATGNVLILDDNERQAERLMRVLGQDHRTAYLTDPVQALRIAAGRVDLIVLNLMASAFDPLRWVAQLRTQDATRQRPVLVIANPDDRSSLLKALELGVNDAVPRPVDSHELLARARTQIRRKRYGDFLRNTLDRSLELAVTDPLTRLNNRRFLDNQLGAHLARHIRGGAALSLLMVDIDYFKRINDGYGHDAGDEVLREFARRLSLNVRAIDLPCRFGGEEFVVLMPETDASDALNIAERVRSQVAEKPFVLANGASLQVTVSVGVATSLGLGDSREALLKRADEAVYEAKQAGRNRVIVRSAA
ncbi:PleD family two-component system response regulator [Asticcacaulis sp. EMRT-3]|uniref:PleD family two-component system response regulator n=1 Tax=Asticcacaulis sp. EMRT-3 TaxID=3040349 RepID=UPI0024AE9BDA|nr:PleD family two-component system response regulator [Asticcacaulis sp. EMRT-3]MDI7774122.1 PleD family two-component system response regulator [Asticcacaulis sp. EMRT-3]